MGAVPKLFYDLWFPRNTQNITIVAPPSSDNLADAELTSSNYALLDRLGDRDSIYAMGKLLSRRYPRAVIHLASADDFKRPNFSQNFVIIGGPGSKDAPPGTVDPMVGNRVCRDFSGRLSSRFHYSDDCETLHLDGKSLVAQNDAEGHMTKDHGVFTAFVNPYLRSTRIVMLHGIHTLGVLGATRLFDGELDSTPNFTLLEQMSDPGWDSLRDGFECLFEVNILYGEVECPTLDPANIFTLRKFDTAIKRPAAPASLDHGTSIISASELRDDILHRLEVARQQTLSMHEGTIADLHKAMKEIGDPDTELMQRILEICRQNIKIPPENVKAIRSLLNNDLTKAS